jgi:tRNA dimethylallyltransferase
MISTGKSILYFRENPKTMFIQDVFYEFNIMVTNRQTLYSRIDERVNWMLKNGAIEEVQALLSRFNDKIINGYPIFNAIGAKEIASYLRGAYSYDIMANLIKLNTRHYAKRQITWFRHQVHESEFLKIKLLES